MPGKTKEPRSSPDSKSKTINELKEIEKEEKLGPSEPKLNTRKATSKRVKK